MRCNEGMVDVLWRRISSESVRIEPLSAASRHFLVLWPGSAFPVLTSSVATLYRGVNRYPREESKPAIYWDLLLFLIPFCRGRAEMRWRNYDVIFFTTRLPSSPEVTDRKGDGINRAIQQSIQLDPTTLSDLHEQLRCKNDILQELDEKISRT